METNEAYVKELRIKSNIRTLFGGNRKKEIPVLAGHAMNRLDPEPVSASILGGTTCITLSQWVDANMLFKNLGISEGQAVRAREAYHVSTDLLDQKLQTQVDALGRTL